MTTLTPAELDRYQHNAESGDYITAYDTTVLLDHITQLTADLKTHEAAAREQRVATHRHRKRGTEYRIVGRFQVQTSTPIVEGDIVYGYVAEDGSGWARLVSEFEDGRFENIDIKRCLPHDPTLPSEEVLLQRRIAQLIAERDEVRSSAHIYCEEIQRYGEMLRASEARIAALEAQSSALPAIVEEGYVRKGGRNPPPATADVRPKAPAPFRAIQPFAQLNDDVVERVATEHSPLPQTAQPPARPYRARVNEGVIDTACAAYESAFQFGKNKWRNQTRRLMPRLVSRSEW